MKLNSIQFLRAVAALLVVYEHSLMVQKMFSISSEQNFFYLDHFGCIGVDLFFVISGFIIMYVANSYEGLSQGFYFLAKRFCRINPVYYIATLCLLAIIIFRLEVDKSISASFEDIGKKLSDSILIFPTTDTVDSYSPLLIVGWTLAFEWLFYIIFFSLILLKIKRKTLFLAGIIGCLVILGRILHFNDLRLIFFTNPIIMEFLLGIVICYSYLNIKRIPAFVGSIFLSTGIVGYLLLIVFGFGDVWLFKLTLSGDQSFNRFLFWGIPSSFIVAGSVILEKAGKLNSLWSNKAWLLAGDASYSIYLIHLCVLNLCLLLFLKAGAFLSPDTMIWAQIAIAILISIIFYQLVEKPLLQYMYRSSIWNNYLLKRRRQQRN